MVTLSHGTSFVILPEPNLSSSELGSRSLGLKYSRSGKITATVDYPVNSDLSVVNLRWANLCRTDRALLRSFIINLESNYLTYTSSVTFDSWRLSILDEDLSIVANNKQRYEFEFTALRWDN